MLNMKESDESQRQVIQEKIRAILKKLNTSARSIEASSVITSDGFSIASVLGDGVDPDRFSAMCASLLALAETTAKEINRGRLKQVLIEGELGAMLVVHINADTVLAVAARSEVNLGMVFMEARKAATFLNQFV